MTENERLSMDEIIAHCNRHTERMEQTSSRIQLEEIPVGNSERMKKYWEHRQVAEWIEELKTYRAIGTIEEFKALKEKSVEKKPIRRKGMCYAKAKDGTEDYEIIEECPTCKNRLYAVSFNVGYCRCGQKITV